MLVLSRHRDEAIMINDDVEIVVVDIRGDKVRLGVNAPPSVAVHRKEIYEAISAENANAARLDSVAQIGGHLGAGRAAAIRAIAAGRIESVLRVPRASA